MATGTNPSKSPKYGSTVAVASMSNAQLGSYYFSDVRVGAAVQMQSNNGLKDRLADGRAGTADDYEDAAYIHKTLGF